MKLTDLLKKIDYTCIQGSDDIEINNLCNDSRKVGENDVFVCIKGTGFNGHAFAEEVCRKGAIALVVSEDVFLSKEVTVIKVEDTREALADMSAAFFGYPAEKLTTIGITGTKGKTTTTYMVRSILENAGIKCGLIGTIEAIIGSERIPAANTTPESILVQEYFAKMVEEGCKCVVMEVSSQALMLHRVAGFTFDYGIVTNIEPDHISENEHKDFADYLHCKSRLLQQCKVGLVNYDMDHLEEMLEGHTCRIETYGIDGDYDFTAGNIELLNEKGRLGIRYDLKGKLNFPVEMNIPGLFNVYNSLCAVAICSHFTKDEKTIRAALSDVRVKGRTQLVDVSDRFTIMIDYAHNAMSLESLLRTLREYQPGRLITIFGCGGNRAKDRRFEMGEISSKMADLTIITSDNPRYEEPMEIIRDIITGVEKADGKYVVKPDRQDAVTYAVQNAQEGDIIVLAGKGHEDYQIIAGIKYPMDEESLIRNAAKDLPAAERVEE